MTGYGEHRAKIGNLHWICRAKSLNHRFLDLKVRSPRNDWTELDLMVRKSVAEFFKRGSVELTLSIDSSKTSTENLIDQNLAQKYLTHLKTLQKKLKLKTEKISLEALLKMPGVVQYSNASAISHDEELDTDDFKRVVEQVVLPALKALKQARHKEGQALAKHFHSMLNALSSHAKEIEKLEEPEKKQAVDLMKERIQETLKLFSSAEPSTTFETKLAEEASFWIERRDFTEERIRLETHIQNFHDELKNAKEEGVGRKLEFMQQELLREVNTLGTKAQSPAITAHTIEMKSILEKMKEQLANVS